MAAPAWLTARPIAHRGLHDRAAGTPENTVAAARAAIAKNFAIECDVQASADGEAVVFHDAALGRLCGRAEAVQALGADVLARLPVAGSAETIPTLPAFLAAIAGRVPLVLEIKSRFDGDLALLDRVCALAADYPGPLALKSFDPRVVAALRGRAPEGIPRGIVAESSQDDPAYAALPESERRSLAHLLHVGETRPDFLSWRVDDLPNAATHLARHYGGLPVMAWTVRTPDQRARAVAHADQMVFEGFVP